MAWTSRDSATDTIIHYSVTAPTGSAKLVLASLSKGSMAAPRVEVDCLPSIRRPGKSADSHGGGRSGSSGMVQRFHGPRCTTVLRHPCHHVSDMMAASQQHLLGQAVLRRRQRPSRLASGCGCGCGCLFTPRRRPLESVRQPAASVTSSDSTLVFPTSSDRLRLASEPPACLTVSGGPRSSRLVRRRSRGLDHDG